MVIMWSLCLCFYGWIRRIIVVIKLFFNHVYSNEDKKKLEILAYKHFSFNNKKTTTYYIYTYMIRMELNFCIYFFNSFERIKTGWRDNALFIFKLLNLS